MIDRLAAAPVWLHVLLLVGAVARLTVLIVRDKLTERPRNWVKRRGGRTLAYLVGCPFCVSMWCALGAGTAYVTWVGPTVLAGLVGTAALLGSLAAVAMIHLMGPEDPPPPHDG